MNATINTLFESDFYRILDFKCECTDCRTSKPEYSNAFCISFVRKGNFLFNVFRNSLDSYTGCILITKRGYERTVTHIHAVPDECTILEFKNDFSAELAERFGHTKFFYDNDTHSTLVRTNAETEFLHFMIMRLALNSSSMRLQIDNLVLEIVNKVLGIVTDYTPDPKVNARLKKAHLTTIERAKEYMTLHLAEDISLMEIASYCYVSPFHFSRIFKTFTSVSPHQFLLNIRLKNAEMLLRTSSTFVGDVAFSSGFNSIEYFTAAFRQKYHCPPAQFRDQHISI